MATTNPLLQPIDASRRKRASNRTSSSAPIAGRARRGVAQVLQEARTCGRGSTPRPARSSCTRSSRSSPTSTDPGDARFRSTRRSELYGDEAEVDMEIEFPEADRRARPHRRADRQAGHLPEGARGRAREYLRRVQPADRRSRQRHGQALRERRHHRRARPRRGAAAAQGTVARGKLRARRPRPRRDQGRQPQREGPADRPVAHGPGAARSSCSSRKCRRSTTAP